MKTGNSLRQRNSQLVTRRVLMTSFLVSIALGFITMLTMSNKKSRAAASPPVELITFDAKIADEKVNLNWSTASEVNNESFTIGRSADGINFKKLLSKKGAGNSTTASNYEAVDPNPLDGYTYYQLQQTDFEGNVTNSDIVVVYFDKKKTKDNTLKVVSVSEFTQNLKVKYKCRPGSKLNVQLLNTTGKVISETNIQTEDNENTVEFNPEMNVAAGIYFVQILGEGEKAIVKIVKR